jgi:hypothetical protein
VKSATDALKALRVASPALRAADGLDRGGRTPRCSHLSTAFHDLLTRKIDSAIVRVFFMAAFTAAPSASPGAERDELATSSHSSFSSLDTQFLVAHSRD